MSIRNTTTILAILSIVVISYLLLAESLPASRQLFARLRQRRQNNNRHPSRHTTDRSRDSSAERQHENRQGSSGGGPATTRMEGVEGSAGGACDQDGRIYNDGEQILEANDRIVFECRVYGDGSWSTEPLGCRTENGTIVRNKARFRSGSFQDLCLMGKKSPSGLGWVEVGPVGCYTRNGQLKKPEESWTESDGEPHVCTIVNNNTLKTGQLLTVDCGNPKFEQECFFSG